MVFFRGFVKAQPSNQYIFGNRGACSPDYSVNIYDCARENKIVTVNRTGGSNNFYEYQEVIRSVQECFYLDFNSDNPCYFENKYVTIKDDFTEQVIWPYTDISIILFWSPIIEPYGRITPAESSSGTNLSRSYIDGLPTAHRVEVDQVFRLHVESAYTGNDIGWYLKIGNSYDYITSGQSVVISAKTIIDALGGTSGYNKQFSIIASAPYYDIGDDDIVESVRYSYMKLGPIEIEPKALTVNNSGSCNGKIGVQINGSENRVVDWQVGQVPDGGSNYVFETFFQDALITDLYLYSNVFDYSELEDHIYDYKKTFALRAVFNNSSIPYTDAIGSLRFFPERELFTLGQAKKACIKGSKGVLRITRTDTEFEEKFQFLEGSEPAPIDSFYMYPNEFIKDITNLNTGTYILQSSIVIDSNHSVCLSSEVQITIGEYGKPTLTNSILSPWCQYDNASVQVEAETLNTGSGTTNIYMFNSNHDYDEVVSKTVAKFTGLNLENEPYYTKLVDPAGCYSDSLVIPQTSYDDITFLINTTSPSCYDSDDGNLAISSVDGGPNGTSYRYSIGNGFTTSPEFEGLEGNTYTVTVRDANNAACLTSRDTLIEAPPELTDTAYAIHNIDCYGDLDGSIRLYGKGGTSPLYYNFFSELASYTRISINDTLYGMSPGIYHGWLSDSHGCTSDTVYPLELTSNSEIRPNMPEFIKESCLNTFDGKIILSNVSGGVEPYTFTSPNEVDISGDTISGVSSSFGAGYQIQIIDSLNCSVQTTVHLPDPETIRATYRTFSPECLNDSSGYLVIDSIYNGNPGYEVSLEANSNFIFYMQGDTVQHLPEGNYILYIRDTLYNDTTLFIHCSADTAFEITDKPDVTLLPPGITDPLCFGDSTGSIVIRPVSGPNDTSNYYYQWYESNDTVGWSRNLSGIPSGNYRVDVFYGQGCPPVLFEDMLVEDPPQLLIDSLRLDSASCLEVADGSITIYPSGGTREGSYYSFSNGGDFLLNHSEFTDLRADSIYILSVMDDHGCITSQETILEAGEVILLLTDTSMVTCYGDNDGTISLEANGGTGNYHYSIEGPGLNENTEMNEFSLLRPGIYEVFAHDENTTCESELMEISITEPDLLEINTGLVDSSACEQPLGIVSFEIVGGNGSNTVIWERNGSVIQNIDLNELYAGFYRVTVEDRKACYAEDTITVPDRPAPEITGHEVLDSTWCHMPLGRIVLLVDKGSPEFHYEWSHDDDLDMPEAGSLRAGHYIATITDRYECEDIYEFDFDDGPALQPSATVADAHCSMNDGSALLEVEGGIKPYEYLWPDSITPTPIPDSYMENLYAGDYEVIIIDSIGCDTSVFVRVANLDGPEARRIRVTKSWCGLPTGTAVMSVNNGTAPYTFAWREYNNTLVLSADTVIEGIAEGNYVFRVTDSVGCIDIEQVAISDSLELEPDMYLVSMDSAACGKPLGALTVEMDGGLSPYTYRWNTSESDTLNTLSGLVAGTYQVTATDSRSCVKNLDLNVIDRRLPDIRIVSKEDAYCSKPTGEIVLGLNYGRGPFYAYLLSEPEQNYDITYVDSIGAYRGLIDSLLPSDQLYSVMAVDSDGCESNIVANYINDINTMTVSLLNLSSVSCYGDSDGSAAILAGEGKAPYSYAWSENSVDAPENTQLSGGLFTVTVTDTWNCIRIAGPYTIPEPARVQITGTTLTEPSCFGVCNGSLAARASGGTGTLYYIWNDSDTARTITGRCAGDYYLKVIDVNECSTETYLTLTQPAIQGVPGIPDRAEVCEGQEYILDPGEGYMDCSWTSTNGFTCDSGRIAITESGEYYLSAISNIGCVIADTLNLVVSDNLLQAEFLMASEGYVGDTIVIIEVSWPYAEVCNWTLPEEADVLSDTEYYKELVFRNAGTYYIELNAQLATCIAMKGKYIGIYSSMPGKSSEDPLQPRVISSFDVFPNPARENLNLKIKLSEEEDIRVELIGMSGEKVNDSVIGYGADEYEASLDVSSLKPGIYLLRLIAGGQTETRMLVVH